MNASLELKLVMIEWNYEGSLWVWFCANDEALHKHPSGSFGCSSVLSLGNLFFVVRKSGAEIHLAIGSKRTISYSLLHQ